MIERFRPTFALIKRLLLLENELSALTRLPELEPPQARRLRELAAEKNLRLAQLGVELLSVPDPGPVPDNMPTR